MNELRNQSVLVIGLGETGLSLARWLTAQGAQVCVADSRATPPGADTLYKEMPQVDAHFGPFRDESLIGIDRIAISPGVPLAEPFVQRAIARGIPVVGDIELLAQEINTMQHKPKVIAITGSNGKTTVTSMVGAMCAAAGLDTQVAGNISPAVLDALREREEKQPQVWVLELSSFQLETTHSLDADAAVVLNVTEDHLDRYDGSMDRYAAAKLRIFHGDGVRLRHVTAEQPIAGAAAMHPLPHQTLTRTVSGVQVVNRDDARSAAMRIAGRKCISFGLNQNYQLAPNQSLPPSRGKARMGVESGSLDASTPSLTLPLQGGGNVSVPNEMSGVNAPLNESDWGITHEGGVVWLMQGARKIMRADELQVSGLHNVANALAALALCRALDMPLEPLVEALRAFKGLPHRVEKVAELFGVTYYDDSKGTNVGATEAALKGLGRPAVVILGGDGKGQDFAPLKDAVAEHARAAVLIGRDAPLIEKALAGCGKPVVNARDMDEAVRIATSHAQAGDAVLMSPACASFDMYKNYLHRAQDFIAAVKKVEASCSVPH